MHTYPISAILVHVPDVEAGLDWYKRAFPNAVRSRISKPIEFEYLSIDGVMLEIVPSDEKVRSGAAGSIVYWAVNDFTASLRHLLSVGAKLYRGPLNIEDG